MFSLQLFGGASLYRAGEPVPGPVAQRRRLAVLALLTGARDHALPREKLIAYLWPESETDRGRHLLSEALYVIRKALGDSALSASGEEVRLNPAIVTTDVSEFESACASGQFAEAVAVYRGPFLDGFFLDQAPEFERWADQERARLAAGYRRALEEEAQRRGAAGDLVGAVDAWRQLAVEDRYNSRVALQLMQALAASGDRMGALQHARVHAALIRGEFDAEPDPAIVSFAELLRREPESARRDAAPDAPADLVIPASVTVDPPLERDAVGYTNATAHLPPADPRPRAEQNVESGAGARADRRPRRRVAAAVGLLVVLGAVFAAARTARTPEHAASNDHVAIAVLPFVDLSPTRDHEWLSDGMTEDLITALAGLDGVRVAARGSVFTFKGSGDDPREIGRRLGVTHVLEGSVRKIADRLRITAQLISVGDGYPVWSETYTLDLQDGLRDVFRVTDDISRSIVGGLRVRLDPTRLEPSRHARTTDLAAYQLYQQARFFWNKRSPDALARSLTHFLRAIEHDPSYAAAHAGVADAYALMVTFGTLSPQEGYAHARAAAERALSLDPSLAEAHASLALVKLYVDWDWTGAETQFLRALQLSPSYATARSWYAQFLAYRGEHEAALREARRAQELDPLSLPVQTVIGSVLYYARRYEEAAEQFLRVLEMEPGFYLARLQLAAAYFHLGRMAEALTEAADAVRHSERHPLPLALLGSVYAASGRAFEAREVIEELKAQAGVRHVSPVYPAVIHMSLGETDQALDWLQLAFDVRDDWAIIVRAEPTFDPLRSDARYEWLLARAGP